MRFAAAIFLLVAPTIMAQEARASEWSVTFRVVDAFGKPVPYHVEKFTLRVSGQEMRDKFSGLRGSGIRDGAYNYVLGRDRPGSALDELSGLLSVEGHDTLTTLIGTTNPIIQDVGTESTGPWEIIRGRIVPHPTALLQKGSVSVRMSGVYSRATYDAKVDNRGEFRIYGWPLGLYILTVTQGGRVLCVQPISFEEGPKKQDIVISIPPSPPLTIRLDR